MPSGRARGRSSIVGMKLDEQLRQAYLKLDEETVKTAGAAAASSRATVRSVRPSERKAQQQRIDAALAELARGGDRISAAKAGGFEKPLEQPPPDIPAVPHWLSYAPPIMGAVSIALFVLNSYGIFGEGPDLSSL